MQKNIERLINKIETGDRNQPKTYNLLTYNPEANIFTDVNNQAEIPSYGKTLLLIHGTFSSYKGFDTWLADGTIKKLSEVYDTILAFDHPTVRHGIIENYVQLTCYLDNDSVTSLDMIGTSRGGILAAYIKQQNYYLVNQVVCVAAPLFGSPWVRLHHNYTNKTPSGSIKKTLRQLIKCLSVPKHIKFALRFILSGNGETVHKIITQPGLADQMKDSIVLRNIDGEGIGLVYSNYEGNGDAEYMKYEIRQISLLAAAAFSTLRFDFLKIFKVPARWIIKPSKIIKYTTDILTKDPVDVKRIIFSGNDNDLVVYSKPSDRKAFHGSLLKSIGGSVVFWLSK